MKKILTATVAASLAGALAASAEVSVTADFASAYVFRGATFNDGAVFQPGIEATGMGIPESYGGVTVGAWGNFDIDDYDGAMEEYQFSETDWYASYSLPSMVEGLDLFVGFTQYQYSYSVKNDKEANVGVGYSIGGLSLGATAYYGVGGLINKSAYYELTAGYDLAISEKLGASVGASAAYVDIDGGDNGLNDGSLSAGLSYALSEIWSAGASVKYIAQLDDEILVDVDNGGLYDVDLVGTLSIGATF